MVRAASLPHHPAHPHASRCRRRRADVPRVTHITPTVGPMSGGTVVVVRGNSFGHGDAETYKCRFGGQVVMPALFDRSGGFIKCLTPPESTMPFAKGDWRTQEGGDVYLGNDTWTTPVLLQTGAFVAAHGAHAFRAKFRADLHAGLHDVVAEQGRGAAEEGEASLAEEEALAGMAARLRQRQRQRARGSSGGMVLAPPSPPTQSLLVNPDDAAIEARAAALAAVLAAAGQVQVPAAARVRAALAPHLPVVPLPAPHLQAVRPAEAMAAAAGLSAASASSTLTSAGQTCEARPT